MKRLPLLCLLASGVLGLHAETFIDNARVRSVHPRYENVAGPCQECNRQRIQRGTASELRPAIRRCRY